MKIYLDVCCLNRPFDDQRQPRIRLEAEAVVLILQRCADGQWQHVSSQAVEMEIQAGTDLERSARVRQTLSDATQILSLTTSVFQRAEAIAKMGIKPADALHLASAEAVGADVLLTTDDRLVRAAPAIGPRSAFEWQTHWSG